MIGAAPEDAPVVLCRFDSVDAAERGIEALLEAGIASGCIDAPMPRTFTVAIKAAGRSDRHFIAETLRELGAEVRVVEPLASE